MACLIVLGSLGLWIYQDRFSSDVQIRKLQAQTQELQTIVQRLSTERRVADLMVLNRQVQGNVPVTTLLFVEYDRKGNDLPAKSFVVRGNDIHIDAMVIMFDRDLVKADDPLRGHSIALFTSIYGDRQMPANATQIDAPGSIPDIYRGADAHVTAFETSLWAEFWKLTEDKELREKRGVRIAEGQGVWGPLQTDKLYTLTLDNAGGLNLSSEPMKGIYRAAIGQRVN
jgi:hypothetical protein